MKVAVITPYFRTPLDWLHQCHASVRAQTHEATHILVADGEPIETVDTLDAHHIVSMGPNDDVGNTARNIGSIAAIRQGFDAICYLDADNWYRPDHVAQMVALHKETKAAVCASARTLHHIDGRMLGVCFENDGETFVDTNCMFLAREAFPIISAWHMVDRRLDPVGDRVVWFQIKKLGLQTAYSQQPTVCYRTNYIEHYKHFNAEPPEGARKGFDHYPSRKLFDDLKASALGQSLPLEHDDGMLPSFRPDRHLLISVIGLPRPQIDRIMEGLAEECAAEGKIPVLLVDDIDLAVSLSQTYLIEHVPGVGSRDALAPDLDWDLYIDRRLRQIKEKWASGHIVSLGLPLEVLVGGAGASVPPASGKPALAVSRPVA